MRRSVAVALLGLAMALLITGPVRAETVTVSIPTIIAPPGANTSLQIELDRDLIGLNVIGIDYHLALNPAVISSAAFEDDGLVLTWGPPFSNIQPNLVAVSAGGTFPVSSNSRRLHSLAITVAPGCPIGDYPLTLTLVRFNGGEPAAAVVNGVLQVRAGVDAPAAGAASFALSAAFPNPARGTTRMAFDLPAVGEASLAIYALDGRRVRTLATGTLAAGHHERHWDLRDASGRRVPAGVYFARLMHGTLRTQRRIAVVR